MIQRWFERGLTESPEAMARIMTVIAFVRPGDLYGQPIDINVPEYGMKLLNLQLEDAVDTAANRRVQQLRGETMSKLVEGIKDRMVLPRARPRPLWWTRAEGRDRVLPRKFEAVADAKNTAGETSIASEPLPPLSPVAAAQAPEGAILTPRPPAATCTWASTWVPPPSSSPCSTTTTGSCTPSTSAITPMSAPAPATCLEGACDCATDGPDDLRHHRFRAVCCCPSGSAWSLSRRSSPASAPSRLLIPATDVAIELGGEDAKDHLLRQRYRAAHERHLRRRHGRVHRPDGHSAAHRRQRP